MVSYIGGKSRISKSLIIPEIPKDIHVYVEVFGGMMWNFFKMDLEEYPNLKTIVYNDKNPLNVNLIKCVRNHKEFLNYIHSLDYKIEDTDTFNEYKDKLFSEPFKLGDKPNYEYGFMYSYILTTCYSGISPEKGRCVKRGGYTTKDGKYTSKFESFLKKLTNKDWVEKFNSITFTHCLDFNRVMDIYDNLNTFLYLDPPYFSCEEYYSNHDFGEKDHKRLIKRLEKSHSRWALSYYDFPQLSEWLPKDEYRWISKEFIKEGGAKKGKTKNKGTELLIMNYGDK